MLDIPLIWVSLFLLGSVEMSCFGGGEDEVLKEQKRQNKIIDAQLRKDKDVYKATHRLLLLGESVHMYALCLHMFHNCTRMIPEAPHCVFFSSV